MNTNEKLRRALLDARNVIRDFNFSGDVDPDTYEYEIKKIDEALALPRRNCDVGTAEEQEERYLNLKREHVDRMARCPAVGPSFFPDSLYWAQMPYEKGATHEQK